MPFMTADEIAFLERNLTPTDRVFEWGSGGSTLWLAKRVRGVTSVEHAQDYAASVLKDAPGNVSLLFHPPGRPYVGPDDGTFEQFRDYVTCYTGRGVDVAVLDGRARVACARWIVESAQFGPDPDLRVFLHDAERVEYSPIWQDNPETGWKSYFNMVKQVERLMLLAPRFDR